MLNIVVCVKQIPDPEAPASAYAIDAEAKRVTVKGAPPVLNPFDENALEAALRIKASHQSKITVISMGQRLARPVLIKSLAAGADELLLLEDDTFEDSDSYGTALTLATAIKKMGEYDLILTGMQASDWNVGAVGSGIAEMLNIPSITTCRKVEFNDGKVIVERVVSDGYEVIEAPLPALVTVSHELGELRSISMKELIAGQKKPVAVWKAQELGVTPPQMRKVELLKLSIPQKETKCEIVNGETSEEMGVNLALKLRQAEII